MGPLEQISSQWLNKIKAARSQKKEFTRDGEECMRFFRGPYDFMYGLKEGVPQSGDFVFIGQASGMPRPSVALTINKVAEAVQIFGPLLYHRNPTRKISPRQLPMIPIEAIGDPQNPMVAQAFQAMAQQVQGQRAHDKVRAALLQWYQDYTPLAADLKTESRQAIDEALIKGMGLLWTEPWQPPATPWRIVSGFYDSVDNLYIDGDMQSRKHAKFIVRERVVPGWEFEAKFNLPPGTIKGFAESNSQRELIDSEGGEGEMRRRQGKTNDLVTYYEVYSKMGIGPLMKGYDWSDDAKQLDRFGQYCYLVVCRELPYPANFTPEMLGNEEAVQQAVQWPCPFWSDDCWPYAELVFHDVPNQLWPMSHFKPAMGELKFLNWAYSFLATRMKKSARDIIVLQKSAGEEMKRAILNGEDMELVQIEKIHGTIKEMVEVLQFPQVNGDMFEVIKMITTLFEQRTGLNELMYGETAHAYRSAAESEVKESQLHIRPDDMVNKVEDWMGQEARMEALMERWLLDPQRDIEPVMGQIGAQWWQQFITPTDPTEILHQLEYRIEANSSKKPNKDKDMADADQAMQQLFQPLSTVAIQHGTVDPINALITVWSGAHGWDAGAFLFPPPPPPPPPPPDKPKINVAIKFEELRPDIQAAIIQDAGLVPVQPPPGPPLPGQPPQPQGPPQFAPGPLAMATPKPVSAPPGASNAKPK